MHGGTRRCCLDLQRRSNQHKRRRRCRWRDRGAGLQRRWPGCWAGRPAIVPQGTRRAPNPCLRYNEARMRHGAGPHARAAATSRVPTEGAGRAPRQACRPQSSGCAAAPALPSCAVLSHASGSPGSGTRPGCSAAPPPHPCLRPPHAAPGAPGSDPRACSAGGAPAAQERGQGGSRQGVVRAGAQVRRVAACSAAHPDLRPRPAPGPQARTHLNKLLSLSRSPRACNPQHGGPDQEI